jgi:uncharacterized membrane-anchored protein
MNRKLAFQVAVALQLVFLGWMVAAKERTLATGTRVVLKVQPIDPVDYRSGHYIQITPAIARIDPAKVPLVRGPPGAAGNAPAGAENPDLASLAGRTAFVELTHEGELWEATRVVVEGAGVLPHLPFLRARVEVPFDATLRLDYSLERFYIPADGHDPSSLARDPNHSIRVVVRVPNDGAGVIEELLVDGKTWKEWDAAERAKER